MAPRPQPMPLTPTQKFAQEFDFPADVEINGKRARGELNGSAVEFRKESGDWKFHMTASQTAECWTRGSVPTHLHRRHGANRGRT
jgi:hypothetical protein